MKSVNPEMLIVARESRGLTQSALAGIASISQATLSKYETGTTPVSDEHLAILEKKLEYPAAFLQQEDPIRWVGSGCMYNRKRQALTATEYKRLLARTNVLRLGIWRLLRSIEIDAENRFVHLSLAEYGTPEKVAVLTRQLWNLPPGPIFNLTTAIESCGGIVVRCDFGTAKLDAFAQWPTGMPPIFFVNQDAPPDRYRYTLAHEIGHIVMHDFPTADMEREANLFAAEFLMPKRDIRSHLVRPFTLQKAAELKSHWKVAISALIRRAHDLGTISASHYRMLMTQMSKLGFRTREPVPLDSEEPSVLANVIGVHCVEHRYSLAELSRIALLNEGDFARLFPMPDRGTKPNQLRVLK